MVRACVSSVNCTQRIKSKGDEDNFSILYCVTQAGQACEVETLTPLIHRCNKLILVGDPKQLPPTVISLVSSLYSRPVKVEGASLEFWRWGVFVGSSSLFCRGKYWKGWEKGTAIFLNVSEIVPLLVIVCVRGAVSETRRLERPCSTCAGLPLG